MFGRFRRNKETSTQSHESEKTQDDATYQQKGSRLMQLSNKLAGGESAHRSTEEHSEAQLAEHMSSYEKTEQILDDRDSRMNGALDAGLDSIFAGVADEYNKIPQVDTRQNETAKTSEKEKSTRGPWRHDERYFKYMEDHPEEFRMEDFPGYYPVLTDDLRELLSSDMPIDELRRAIDKLKSQTDKARQEAVDANDHERMRFLSNKSDALGRARSYLGYDEARGLNRQDIIRELQIREQIGHQYYEDHKNN